MVVKVRSSALAIFSASVVSLSLLADSAIQFTERETAQIIASGPWPMTAPADPGNEYSGIASAEALGKQLIDDPGLSGNGEIACASCHVKELGFTDGRAIALGHARHIRNTPVSYTHLTLPTICSV